MKPDLSKAVRFADFEARPAVVIKSDVGSDEAFVRGRVSGNWVPIMPVLFDAPDVSGMRELSKEEFFELFADDL